MANVELKYLTQINLTTLRLDAIYNVANTDTGICWSTSTAPTINDNSYSFGSGTGEKNTNVTINKATTYYFRAYYVASSVYYYSNEFYIDTEIAQSTLDSATFDYIDNDVTLEFTLNNSYSTTHTEIHRRRVNNDFIKQSNLISYFNFDIETGEDQDTDWFVRDSVQYVNGRLNYTGDSNNVRTTSGKIGQRMYINNGSTIRDNSMYLYDKYPALPSYRTNYTSYLKPNLSFSFSMWFRRSVVNTKQYLFYSTSSDGNYTITAFIETSNQIYVQFASTNGVGQYITANPISTDGASFKHIAVTYSPTNAVRIYVNNILQTLSINGSWVDYTTDNLNSSWGNDFRGSIDEVGFWNTELTSTDVSTLYNGGAAYYFDGWKLLKKDCQTTTYVDNYDIQPNQTYEYKVEEWTGTHQYYSPKSNSINVYTGTPPPINPPSGLTASNITITGTTLTWVNNNTANVVENVIQISGGTYNTWIDLSSVASGTTTYNVTGLTPYTNYSFKVVAKSLFLSEDSNVVSIKTLLPIAPPSFCSLNTPYTITNTTCGDANGVVTINNNDYHIFYDFVLTDVQNNVHQLTGLTADYYFLTATPKPEFNYIYGKDSCRFDWITITATDSTMSNTSKSVRNSICGGFGNSTGRIVYVNSDTATGSTYTCNLYEKKTHRLVYSSTVTDINEVAFVPLDAGSYYLVIINNDNDCVLLISDTQVKGEALSSVSGIKNLWITEWNSNVEYNYWSQSDEDYYVSNLDPNYFNSIKIKNFVDSTLPSVWYTINIDTKSITYQQTMNKTKQGFVFTDKVELLISAADNDKWKELVDLLSQRYILVFKDNNGNYWCMGYLLGSTVKGYRLSVNQYGLSFESISNNKILTNISEDYVKASIL